MSFPDNYFLSLTFIWDLNIDRNLRSRPGEDDQMGEIKSDSAWFLAMIGEDVPLSNDDESMKTRGFINVPHAGSFLASNEGAAEGALKSYVPFSVPKYSE